MGIIQKQGIKSSVFLMIGFVIGAVNLLFLFPKVLTKEEIGLTRALIDAGTVLSVLATLGTIPVIYKFYPYYKTLKKKNDLVFLTGLICLIGFILICCVGYFFNDFIVRKLGKSPLFAQNVILVYPLTLLMLLFTWMEGFGWALKKASATNFLKETLVRVITTILILCAWAGVVSKGSFINLFSFIYVLPVLILLTILIKTGEFHFNMTQSTVTKKFKNRMFTFGMFVFGATFLNIASRTVDSFMIIGLQGLAETAIFTYAAYLGAFMDLPLRSINSIATPIISESWKDKNYANIATVYKKSTITLLVAGLFIFLIALLSINNLVAFLGSGWEQVPAVFLIMGLAKIVDLGTGVNGQIIATSSNWRFDFFTNVLLTLLAFPLNFFLIKHYGIIGAAFSNLAAISVYNAVRFSFIFKKYGWQPYGFAHIKIILVSLLIFFAVYAVPFIINIYFDTIFRSVLFAGLFVPAMLKMNVSEDFNLAASSFIRRVRGR